ncbi:peptidoglycan editing factor PgeF [Metallumcola ferriviriculae]|uniref:Purine nucleoside phosphorylase n=1 Tax=Metallumcola ferriviriculae TaxID=3039180 RepID=A0AAU0UNY0_9FIRM|nr:peptidoglycan editing factor PgeF [Desulfitibacteraceae bacterium MK1]
MLGHMLCETDGIQYIKYTGINNILTCFSCRTGGVSQPPYQSLNLGLHTGDDTYNVVRNREQLGRAVNMPLSKWVTAQQTHGSNLVDVGKCHAGQGSDDYSYALTDTDGMLTREVGLPLVTFYADCVPIFLLDETNGIVGVVHAGWKGTVLKIAAAAVNRMRQAYNCQLKNIRAIIGPSIGPCCYQVDQPVVKAFHRAFSEVDDIFKTEDEEHSLLNLWSANSKVLQEVGLSKDNIYITGLCTSCREELFFSYRRDKGKTGRMAAMIMRER